MIKRYNENIYIKYEIVKNLSKKYEKLFVDYYIGNKNIFNNYDDFNELCVKYLNNIEVYSIKEIKKNLLEIYNKNKFNSELKSNIFNYIINKWRIIQINLLNLMLYKIYIFF